MNNFLWKHKLKDGEKLNIVFRFLLFSFFYRRITYYPGGLAVVRPNFATHSRPPLFRWWKLFENVQRFGFSKMATTVKFHGPNCLPWIATLVMDFEAARPDPIFSPVTIRQFDLRPCCNLAREEFLSWHWIFFLFSFSFSFRPVLRYSILLFSFPLWISD